MKLNLTEISTGGGAQTNIVGGGGGWIYFLKVTLHNLNFNTGTSVRWTPFVIQNSLETGVYLCHFSVVLLLI